jgi:hypothetical protein
VRHGVAARTVTPPGRMTWYRASDPPGGQHAGRGHGGLRVGPFADSQAYRDAGGSACCAAGQPLLPSRCWTVRPGIRTRPGIILCQITVAAA